jgi:hypothetical protein
LTCVLQTRLEGVFSSSLRVCTDTCPVAFCCCCCCCYTEVQGVNFAAHASLTVNSPPLLGGLNRTRNLLMPPRLVQWSCMFTHCCCC